MEGKGRYIIPAAVAISLIILSFFAGRSLGAREGVVVSQVEAIKAGHAKYVIMDEFGHTEFKWMDKGDLELPKEPKEPKDPGKKVEESSKKP